MSDKKTEELFEKAMDATTKRRGPKFFMRAEKPDGTIVKVEVPDARRFSAYISGVRDKSKTQHWFAFHNNVISHWDSGMRVMSWHPPFGYRYDSKDARAAIEAFNKRVPNMADVINDAMAKLSG